MSSYVLYPEELLVVILFCIFVNRVSHLGNGVPTCVITNKSDNNSITFFYHTNIERSSSIAVRSSQMLSKY